LVNKKNILLYQSSVTFKEGKMVMVLARASVWVGVKRRGDI